MSIPTYIKGFPQDGSNLGNTRVQIRRNLDGTFETLEVDHINNNEVGSNGLMGTAGYHNVIHFQDQGNAPTTPPSVTNVTQMYTNTDTTHSVQQLFVESTAGNAYQQTTLIDGKFSKFGPNGNNNFWTYLPGGKIMICSSTGISNTDADVDLSALGFPVFANKNYNIQVTPYRNAFGSANFSFYVINDASLTPSTFTIVNVQLIAVGFYYTLIGIPA
jgi:hypothetical protein